MYGYIECNRTKLTKEELGRYQSVYCGLCRNLKNRYGQLERFSLTYDMTFLVLFLSSLYEPEETEGAFRCCVHPVKAKKGTENKYTDYAADMTIVLAYFKCLDDWKDEKKRVKRWYGTILEKDYQVVAEKYPRQCKAAAQSLEELDEIERRKLPEPDAAVNCSGKLLAELFACEEDFWSGSLRSFGYELGRFIYLMDAVMDYEKDVKKNNYNPLMYMDRRREAIEPILKMPLGNAMEIFEGLPLVQDAPLLRNILYGGVWQQYYGKILGEGKRHG